MTLTVKGKKVSGRSRCDSPPRCVNACATAEKQACAANPDEETSSPAWSSILPVVAIALLLGHAALNTDREELLGNTPTRIALAVFLIMGVVAMRLDFMEAMYEESEKEGLQCMDQVSLVPAGLLLILGLGAAFFLALALVWSQGSILAYKAPHASVDDTPTWTGLVIFMVVGAIVMRFDYMDAMKEEAEKEGQESFEQVSLIPGCRHWLIMGSGVAVAFAAQHLNISWQLSDEATIFFLSAALVVGLATTFFVIGLYFADKLSGEPKKGLAMK